MLAVKDVWNEKFIAGCKDFGGASRARRFFPVAPREAEAVR